MKDPLPTFGPDSAANRGFVLVHESVIENTGELLRQSKRGRRRHEGVVYWAGRDTGSDVIVTTCIAPRAATGPGFFRVEAEENARAVILLNELHLILVAQVHSHPSGLIEHSHGDDLGAFMPFENYLSIIVPDYGRKNPWPLTTCGVYRFLGGVFVALSKEAIEAKFRLLPKSCDLR